MRALLLIAAASAALGGCASFTGGGEVVRAAELAPAGATLWTYDLGDPGFAAYLHAADLGSLDVKTALARARAADADLHAARAEGWPELTLGALGARTIPGRGPVKGATELDLVGKWTLDLWGEVRAASAAAGAEARAAGLDVQAARAVLAAEAARTWLSLAAVEDRLARLDDRRIIETDGLAIAERRIAAGRAGRDEALERQANLARILDDRRAAEGEAMVIRQRLIALAGPASQAQSATPAALADLMPFTPGGLDSADLEKRPDVAAAVARLEAADARRLSVIRAARPRLTLTAALRGEDNSLSGLLRSRSLALAPGVRLEGAILDGGRSRARADKAAAETAASEIGYLKALVAAESDLASALALITSATARQSPANEAVDFTEQRLRLARARLDAGTAGRLDAIDAERAVIDAREAQALTRRALIEASIGAQAALVGGTTIPSGETR